MTEGGRNHRSRALADFLERRKEAVLRRWEESVRDLPAIRALSRDALRDHLPQMLDAIAELAARPDGAADSQTEPLGDLPERHAIERLGEGVEIEYVVAEYAALRNCLIQEMRADGLSPDLTALATIDRLVDRAIEEAVRAHVTAHGRVLRSLDRFTDIALSSGPDVQRVLEGFVQEVAAAGAVDTVAVLLCESGRLKIGAAVGLDEEVRRGFSLSVGQGFAETVAERREPMLLAAGSGDPRLKSDALRRRGLRALYGAPMLAGGDLVGVAHMGSCKEGRFSEDEMMLLRSMAARAAWVVAQARAESEAAGLVDAALDCIVSMDAQGRITRWNEAAEETFGYTRDEALGRTVAGLIVPPRLRDAHHRGVERVIATGRTRYIGRRLELPGLRRDGTEIPVELSVTRLPGDPPRFTGFLRDISEVVRQREESQRLSAAVQGERSRLAAILEQMPGAVLIAEPPDGRIVFANEQSARLLGLSLEEIRSLNAATYDRFGVRRPDGTPLPTNEYGLARALRGESASGVEVVYPLSDGGMRVIGVSYGPVRSGDGGIDAAVVILSDVTERWRRDRDGRILADASTALASSLDHQAALEAFTAALVPRLADGCVIDVVNGSSSLREPLVVRAVEPERAQRVRQLRRRWAPAPDGPLCTALRTGEAILARDVSDEALQTHARDDEHLAMLRALGDHSYLVVPLLLRDRVVGALSLATGPSRRRLDAQDLTLAEELSRRAALAVDNARLFVEQQRATNLRDQVLAIVSHDLRNPLQTIQLSAEALFETLARPEPVVLQRQAEVLRRSADQMARLIADLLDLASIQAGQLRVETAPEDPMAIVAQAAEQAEPLARRAGVRLLCALPETCPPIRCDRGRILQVLSNLIGNAVKFGSEGDEVRLRVAPAGADVCFGVEDTGPGIPADALPHLFDPYWTAARHGKSGTGLGLFISKGIAEAHGGRIWAEAGPERGSVFRFTVPQA